jgi:hypothetical protein
MISIDDKLTYDAGIVLIAGVFQYKVLMDDNNKYFFEPKNSSMDSLHNTYNQAIIRMDGRAAQEISGLEISLEKFYNDLKLAVPHFKNIAAIEGKHFPIIDEDEYKEIPEENYQIYIQAAKLVITRTAQENKTTEDKIIKKIATNIKLLSDNRYN